VNLRRVVLTVFILTLIIISVSLLPVQAQSGLGTNWTGEYYRDPNFTNLAVTRIDPMINYFFGQGAPQGTLSDFPVDNFSIHWSGTQTFSQSGIYRFTIARDEDAQVMFNGQVIIPFAGGIGDRTYSVDIPVTAGDHYIQVQYRELTSDAYVQFLWTFLVEATSLPVTVTPNFPGELLNNNGFEGEFINDSQGSLNGWKVKNNATGKVKCNKPSKVVSYEGECAFQFKGGSNRLEQTINQPAYTAGTVVLLEARIKSPQPPLGDGQIIVVYEDGTPKTKEKVEFTQSENYKKFSVALRPEYAPVPVTKTKIIFRTRGAPGKILIDEVSLRAVPNQISAHNLMPLP
jgi:hypothetical protein